MLDELDTDKVVDMLEGLPAEDRAYYSEPKHVVRGGSRSEQLYQETGGLRTTLRWEKGEPWSSSHA